MDVRSYISAATTRGGMSFDQLCRGEGSYYVTEKECLVHLTQKDTLEEAQTMLVSKIESLFQDLQFHRDAQVTKFYVGKTYIQSTKTSRGRVDPMNPRTWRKQGISGRWSTHKEEDYGRDGMIVIAAITRDQVPLRSGTNQRVTNQEQYTLALEQRLLHYYKITLGDARLGNSTFTSGGTDKKGSAGYVLYVAFRLETDEELIASVEAGGFPDQNSPDHDYPPDRHVCESSSNYRDIQSSSNYQDPQSPSNYQGLQSSSSNYKDLQSSSNYQGLQSLSSYQDLQGSSKYQDLQSSSSGYQGSPNYQLLLTEDAIIASSSSEFDETPTQDITRGKRKKLSPISRKRAEKMPYRRAHAHWKDSPKQKKKVSEFK